jgi:hypothetical protein
MPTEIGPLAAALAKAQAAFPTVKRDKEVKVTTKSGATYTFKYAPLESILAAVRGPLSSNGLVLVQMLDEGALVTTLLHESGASIGGRVDLPTTTNIQELGSAVTYLRRYAIQAMLGIAAEEDDDGNSAAGNLATPVKKRETGPLVTEGLPPVMDRDPGGITGTAEIGTATDSDFQLRETPDGWALGFRLVSDHGGIKVIAFDAIAQALAASVGETVGKRVTVWGRIKDEEFTPKGAKRPVRYQVLTLERIKTPEYELPATVAPGQEALELE